VYACVHVNGYKAQQAAIDALRRLISRHLDALRRLISRHLDALRRLISRHLNALRHLISRHFTLRAEAHVKSYLGLFCSWMHAPHGCMYRTVEAMQFLTTSHFQAQIKDKGAPTIHPLQAVR
jgi:hypothetical protein